MNPSTALARVLVDALVAHGVTELVLSPGSRSAPLALAAFEMSHGDLDRDDDDHDDDDHHDDDHHDDDHHDERAERRARLHVRIDERSAGFLALGLAKRSGQPVAVITTSGSAVANLHPAVLEAHHAGVPLVLLTADRPPELRGVGANQTTDQAKLFGAAVRMFHEVGVPSRELGQVAYWRNLASRAVWTARGDRSRDPGPVHLNIALTGQLPDETGDPAWPEPLAGGRGAATSAPTGSDAAVVELDPGPRTVVLAGDGAGRPARRLAETAGWPLLAEPSSGARSGPNAIGPYRLLLDRPELGDAIERVIAYGTASLSRPVTRLLARPDVEVVVVSDRARWPDPTRTAIGVVPAAALRGTGTGAGRRAPDAWLAAWVEAGAAAAAALDSVLDAEPAMCGPAVARAVAASVGPGRLLFAGSSSPIRDLDLAGGPPGHQGDHPAGQVTVLANRGLSGIDGAVSTAIGAALAHGGNEDRGSVALLGDLAFLHDATGLMIGPDEPRPDLTIVVVNDDGGGLFQLLEQGAPEHAPAFERVFGTPHGVDLAALCAATGTPYALAGTDDELTALLERPGDGICVIEVPITRTDRRALHERIRTAVAAAVDALAGSTS